MLSQIAMDPMDEMGNVIDWPHLAPKEVEA